MAATVSGKDKSSGRAVLASLAKTLNVTDGLALATAGAPNVNFPKISVRKRI